jgi:protein O-GlcNAc transferase
MTMADPPSGQQALTVQQALDSALRHHDAGRLPEAEGLYHRILQADPNQPVALHLLGVIAHQVGKNDIAAELIGKALAVQPDYAEAHSNLGLTLHGLGRFDDAVASYRKALAIQPDFAGAHGNLGLALHGLGRFEDAVASYQKALAIQPDFAIAHNNLGNALENLGRRSEAVASYREALAINPNYANAYNNLGIAYKGLDEFGEAIASFQKALAIHPDYVEAQNNLGIAFKDLGRLDEALACYRKAVALKPDFGVAHFNLGNALSALGRFDEAVTSFRGALAIKPDFAGGYNNLGSAFEKLGRPDEAAASYQRALAITPDDAAAHSNFGNALRALGKRDEALKHYHQALAIAPDYAEAHNNLGNALKDLGRLDEAVASYQKALDLNPDYANSYNNLALALLDLGRLDEALAHYQKALAIQPDFAEAHSNLIFSMSYNQGLTGADILQEARRWDRRHRFQGDIPERRNPADPDRRLRIGLLSGDLRHHSVSYFLDGVLSEIDQDKLEIFAYATAPHEDDMTARLKSIVPHWRQATGRSDRQLAADILADRIDILVDLSGHTPHNRLPLLSRKPAPVQVAWLGYSGTTGVEAIDYILCDRLILPACDEAHFSERPWRLPDIWVCFAPPALDLDVGPPPALANGFITFGSFNNLIKLSDSTLACWASILDAVPQSRLLLKAKQLDDAAVQDGIEKRFAAHGIDGHRLILKRALLDRGEHFSAYHEMDIALDPFPYAGTTTSVEALWMGVPVLTLAGERYTGRAGESILHNVGLSDWISARPQDYIEKAIAFASDLPDLAALREGQRQRLIGSPVCDATRFARNLEAAFRDMWRQWCDQ